MADLVNGRTYPFPYLYVQFNWNGEEMIAFKVDDGILFSRDDEAKFIPPDKIHVKGDEFVLSPDSKNPLNLDLGSTEWIEVTFNENIENVHGQSWLKDVIIDIEIKDLYKDIESFLRIKREERAKVEIAGVVY